MSIEDINRDERRSVERQLAIAKSRPKIRTTDDPIKRKDRRKPLMTISLGAHYLGFSDPQTAGDALRLKMVKEEERRAQHGPVRVIMKNGKFVGQNGIAKEKAV